MQQMNPIDYYIEFFHYLCLYQFNYLILISIINFSFYLYFLSIVIPIAINTLLVILLYKFKKHNFIETWTRRRYLLHQHYILDLIEYIANQISKKKVHFNRLNDVNDDQKLQILFAISYILKDEPKSTIYTNYLENVHQSLKSNLQDHIITQFVNDSDYSGLCNHFQNINHNYCNMTKIVSQMIDIATDPRVTDDDYY
eukprot:TRINITY_DN8054_c0_g1_i1.p1 TRINITY_DN8054_c0_g1~~TRINITY_DN8054_c0_g1_i1.p1  ORF type:complete len:198 (-),score=15.85 TRINITY_DN8054_c0_g1_i1:86-679(-)